MFDKKTLYEAWSALRPLKTWYFFAAFLVSAMVCVAALRANNEHMGVLRSAVYAADQQNSNVETALKALQSYVTSHMNTSLTAGNGSVYPPVQLKYTYERLQTAAQNAAASANSQIYTAAQKYCEQQDPTDFSGKNRVPCIESYVTAHGVNVQAVPTAMYEFDFVSPSWSPDLAGWSMFASGLLLLLAAARFGAGRWLRRASHS